MLKDMARIAAECFHHPRHHSVWSEHNGKYVCPDSEEGKRLTLQAEQEQRSTAEPAGLPTIQPQFKLVFQTAAAGTAIFLVLCVVLTLAAGRDPPPLHEKIIMGFFDLVKIGFGAIVGLLGGQRLQGPRKNRRSRVVARRAAS